MYRVLDWDYLRRVSLHDYYRAPMSISILDSTIPIREIRILVILSVESVCSNKNINDKYHGKLCKLNKKHEEYMHTVQVQVYERGRIIAAM